LFFIQICIDHDHFDEDLINIKLPYKIDIYAFCFVVVQ